MNSIKNFNKCANMFNLLQANSLHLIKNSFKMFTVINNSNNNKKEFEEISSIYTKDTDHSEHIEFNHKGIQSPNIISNVNLSKDCSSNHTLVSNTSTATDKQFTKFQKKRISSNNLKDSNYNLNNNNIKLDKSDKLNKGEHYCLDDMESNTLKSLLRRAKEYNNSELKNSEMNELKDIVKKHNIIENENMLKDIQAWRDKYYV